MSSRYPSHSAGEDGWTEWVQPRMDGYRMACCDCGLVHEVQFRITDDGQKVQMKVRRHVRATGQMRRRKP